MSQLADDVKPCLAAKARLKWDNVRQKQLLLFPEGVLVLNETAYEVLALCDGQHKLAEIVTDLAKRFGSDSVDGDVKDLLERLVAKRLVVLQEV